MLGAQNFLRICCTPIARDDFSFVARVSFKIRLGVHHYTRRATASNCLVFIILVARVVRDPLLFGDAVQLLRCVNSSLRH